MPRKAASRAKTIGRSSSNGNAPTFDDWTAITVGERVLVTLLCEGKIIAGAELDPLDAMTLADAIARNAARAGKAATDRRDGIAPPVAP